jgi:hypothetical protein
MNHGREALYATPCVAGVQFAPPVLSDTSNPTRTPSPDGWFRRKTDMDKTKFFSE